MTPLELADLIEAMGDAVPLGEEIARELRNAAEFGESVKEDLDAAVTEREELAAKVHWAGVELEAYRVSIGLPAHPAGTTGNEHLDWLTDHLT